MCTIESISEGDENTPQQQPEEYDIKLSNFLKVSKWHTIMFTGLGNLKIASENCVESSDAVIYENTVFACFIGNMNCEVYKINDCHKCQMNLLKNLSKKKEQIIQIQYKKGKYEIRFNCTHYTKLKISVSNSQRTIFLKKLDVKINTSRNDRQLETKRNRLEAPLYSQISIGRWHTKMEEFHGFIGPINSIFLNSFTYSYTEQFVLEKHENLQDFLMGSINDIISNIQTYPLNWGYVVLEIFKPIGFVAWQLEDNNKRAYVASVCVDNDWWCKGIGELLLLKMRDILPLSVLSCYGVCRRKNERARIFYNGLKIFENEVIERDKFPKELYVGFEYHKNTI